jgi:cytidine deaminase
MKKGMDGQQGMDGKDGDEELLGRAAAASLRAHSPYSKVRVGAALRGAGGQVFEGCNVENASYGLTMCAERAAVQRAVSEGCTRFLSLAVVSSLDHPLAPCGACRQVLAEFGLDLRIVAAGAGQGERLETTLAALLPHPMGPGDLR